MDKICLFGRVAENNLQKKGEGHCLSLLVCYIVFNGL